MTYEKVKKDLSKIFKGEVADDDATLSLYSKDASLFLVRPRLVVYPKDSDDIKVLVKYVGDKKVGNAGTFYHNAKRRNGHVGRTAKQFHHCRCHKAYERYRKV